MTPSHILAVEMLAHPTPAPISGSAEAATTSAVAPGIVGLKWRETRLYNGKTTKSINTITAVTMSQTKEEGGEQPCACWRATYNVCFVSDNWELRQGNQTGTITIYPIRRYDDNNNNDRTETSTTPACRIVMTVNFVADGILVGAWMKLFGSCIRRYAVAYMTAELEDYGAEAIRREAAKRKKQQTGVAGAPKVVVDKQEESSS